MRIVIAPDKFKGSMTALEAAKAISRGVGSVLPGAELLLFPLSDGGEGLVDSLTRAGEGIFITTRVTDPMGSPIDARWGFINTSRTAIIEISAASGLTLVPPPMRDPLTASTYGTGELIRAALDEGCSRLIIGIGGSATNDGGAGMARALGAIFFDQFGRQLGGSGGDLDRLSRIDISGLDRRLQGITILVACDVDNPLFGEKGAARVYGPQKGATPEMVEQLDRALVNYASIIRKDLGLEVADMPGAGAAGGLGAGLVTFLGAELRPGIELVLDSLNINRYLPEARLLITGEGRLDAQSVHGKVPIGAARRARRFGVPAIALAGSLAGNLDIFHAEGLNACFAIADGPLSLEESIVTGKILLEKTAAELTRLWILPAL